MQSFYTAIDPYLIAPFHITGDPIVNFFLGTFILAFLSVLIGQITLSAAFLINRRHVEDLNRKLIKWNNLSIDTIKAGNKAAYEGANFQANETFGRLFFISAAYSAASLWPAPFALGWMQGRFSSLDIPLPFSIPLLGSSVKYTFVFIVLFIMSYMTFSILQPYLPYFRHIHSLLAKHNAEKEKLRSFTELFENKIP